MNPTPLPALQSGKPTVPVVADLITGTAFRRV
jgi:hypothetical protein